MNIKPAKPLPKTATATAMFRALSDPTRLRLMSLLSEGEQCVCHLVEVLGVPQPTASRHLAYLRKAGLVTGRKQGLWHYYRLTPARSKFHEQLLACAGEWSAQSKQSRTDRAQLQQVCQNDCC